MNICFQVSRAQNRFLSFVHPQAAAERVGQHFFTPRRLAEKPWEREAETNGRRVLLGDGVSAIVWGQGAPVLMMHGWEGRATQMAGFIEPLTGMGYQPISLDAPAHGKSEGDRSSLPRFVDAMFKVQREFGHFAAVIGHSMGGGSALYAISEGLQTDKLVSIAGPADFLHVSTRFARFVGLGRSGTEKFLRYVEQIAGISFEQMELASRAAGLDLPTLLVHDRNDAEIPFDDAQFLSAAMPDACLYATENLGHRRIMRSSLVISAVANFIALDKQRFLSELI